MFPNNYHNYVSVFSLNDHRSTDIKALIRVDLKDEIKYDDESLNLESKFENMDERFKIEGVFLESNGRSSDGMALGQNLFQVKASDLNTGEVYGNIRAFYPTEVILFFIG